MSSEGNINLTNTFSPPNSKSIVWNSKTFYRDLRLEMEATSLYACMDKNGLEESESYSWTLSQNLWAMPQD